MVRSLTPVGSSVHWPSTQNLYWCSPSGRSTMATKLFWLRADTTASYNDNKNKRPDDQAATLGERPYLLFSGILVAQLLKEPDTKTSLPEPDHLNTVGRA